MKKIFILIEKLFQIIDWFTLEVMRISLPKNNHKKVWQTTPDGPFVVNITDNDVACEHPKRKRESIRWDEVDEIRLVTTADGPHFPDMWLLFINEKLKGCSIPTEAKGFDLILDEIKNRFTGFDYEAFVKGSGTDYQQTTVWKKIEQ